MTTQCPPPRHEPKATPRLTVANPEAPPNVAPALTRFAISDQDVRLSQPAIDALARLLLSLRGRHEFAGKIDPRRN
jgi:hypothetical protein